ncbi:TPA: hypothetical protein DD448_00255 [Candidatus Collierbacteria bacterium]|nr:hypothetical protein [Candidatus Collierbacteria bacterium]
MRKHLFFILAVGILIVALALRLYRFTNRAPFDWDQNRDYHEISQIAQGKITLIGPVAKGEGGFLLGPLYYYLALPAYIAFQGNPLSLPFTSLFLDVFAIVAILWLLPSLIGKRATLFVASIWSFSWFAIEASRISWNVALIPLWTVIMIYLLSVAGKTNWHQALWIGLVAGLSWHIHAALIPLAILVTLVRARDLLKHHRMIFYLVGYALALTPLLLFDIRHHGLESRLIFGYLHAQAASHASWSAVIISVLSRLGKNTYAILLGTSDLHLFWGIGTLIMAFWGLTRTSKVFQTAGWLVIFNVILAILLRETGFPEYYLAVSYLSMLLLLSSLLSFKPALSAFAFCFSLIISILAQTKVFTVEPTPFSLSRKMELAQTIITLGSPIDIRYDLPFGRESGISNLVGFYGGHIDQTAKKQALVTDSTDTSVFVDGEIAEDVLWFGGLRLAKREVQ